MTTLTVITPKSNNRFIYSFKLYRNIPIVDIVKSASWLTKLFPFHYQRYNGFSLMNVHIAIPFVAIEIVIRKKH